MWIGTTMPGNKTAPNNPGDTQIARQYLYEKLKHELGGGYASALGIHLASMASEEIFKWFLASALFGARISESVAMNTYREFEKADVLSPEAILKTEWQGLVDILDRGGYVRYDFKTATKLLEVAEALKEKYESDLNRLHFFAEDERDLELKLRSLGKGIGPVTVNIFLREMRDVWEKAEPPLSGPAFLAANNLGLSQTTDAPMALKELKALWETNEQTSAGFSDLEAALVKLGKNYCRKERCSLCLLREECVSPL